MSDTHKNISPHISNNINQKPSNFIIVQTPSGEFKKRKRGPASIPDYVTKFKYKISNKKINEDYKKYIFEIEKSNLNSQNFTNPYAIAEEKSSASKVYFWRDICKKDQNPLKYGPRNLDTGLIRSISKIQTYQSPVQYPVCMGTYFRHQYHFRIQCPYDTMRLLKYSDPKKLSTNPEIQNINIGSKNMNFVKVNKYIKENNSILGTEKINETYDYRISPENIPDNTENIKNNDPKMFHDTEETKISLYNDIIKYYPSGQDQDRNSVIFPLEVVNLRQNKKIVTNYAKNKIVNAHVTH